MAALKPVSLQPVPAEGPLAAASLVTALLKRCASKSLEELYASVRAADPKIIAKLTSVVVTEEQLELIESHGDIVAYLRTGPTTNISQCDGCGKTTVVQGTPPKRCVLTLGCAGAPAKSGEAKRIPFEIGRAHV